MMTHAELIVRNCAAELYLNDIPIRKLDAKVQSFISIPVHQFLVSGANVLQLVVNPGGSPSQARQGATELPVAGVCAEARVVRYTEGMYTGDPGAPKLATVGWQPGPARTARFPVIAEARFDAGPAFGRWAWQGADTINMQWDSKAIMQVVRTVHEAFRTGLAAAVLALGELRLQEGARAYPARPLEGLRARQVDYLARNARREGWAVVPLDPQQHDFRLCAGGTMVEIIDRNWEPSIRSFPMGTTGAFPFPMFLSRIQGQIVISR